MANILAVSQFLLSGNAPRIFEDMNYKIYIYNDTVLNLNAEQVALLYYAIFYLLIILNAFEIKTNALHLIYIYS